MRTRFGPITLDLEMPVGAWRTLKAAEVRKLKEVAVEPRNRAGKGDTASDTGSRAA
jgi:hypothetical protein